jgi:polyprenyl P-hydroxybenzoate/phenylacrylic acid decarboxylase-like protein
MDQLPLIVGISGASGAIYGVRLLEVLKGKVPTHLVVSKSAALTLKKELDLSVERIRALAQTNHQNTDVGAVISSGSFKTRGMVIAPCSIRTLSDIAYGTTDTLLSRAADVTLKERRRLVLVVREAPLHAGHPTQHADGHREWRHCCSSSTGLLSINQRLLTTSSTRQSGDALICLISILVWSSDGRGIDRITSNRHRGNLCPGW